MNKQSEKLTVLFIAIIGSIGFVFAGGKWNVPVMAWIWPFCMIYIYRNAEKTILKVLPFLVIIAGSILKNYGIAATGNVPAEAAFDAITGAVCAVPFILDLALYKKLSGFKATLLLPLAVATVEFVQQLTPFGLQVTIASTQIENLPLAQLASIVGSYGISFLVIWFSTTAMYVIEYRKANDKLPVKPIAVYVSVLSLTLAIGGIRIATVENNDYSCFKVSMSTGIEIGNFIENTETLPTEDSIASLENLSKQAADAGSDIFIGCEETYTVFDYEKEKMLSAAGNAAKENNIYILLGLETESTVGGLGENQLYLFDNDGKTVFTYDKNHLVPGVELGYYTEGNGEIPNVTVTLPHGQSVKLAAIICMDSSFSSFCRDKVNKDTDVLLVPTWDWPECMEVHFSNSGYRAIENGYSMVVSNYDGISFVRDGYGKLYVYSRTDIVGYEHIVTSDVPVKRVHTLYSYTGVLTDWLFPAAIVLLFVLQKKEKMSAR